MQSSEVSRSNTPGSTLDGRVVYVSHASPLPNIGTSSYPSISSPSTGSSQLGHPLFSANKYLSNTPPEARRYMVEAYRVSPSEPSDQVRFTVDPNRVSIDPYRQQTRNPQRVPTDAHRVREDDDPSGEYHRSAEDIYQGNTPIDLQRVPDANSQPLINTQRIVSELQRIHSDPQRQVDDLRAGISLEQLLIRQDVHNNSSSPTNVVNYRHIVSEPLRSPSEPPSRVMQESGLRTHPDPQRMAQAESFREYFASSQRHAVDSMRSVSGGEQRLLTTADTLRYVGSESLRNEHHRYGMNVSQRNMANESLRSSQEASSHLMAAENVRMNPDPQQQQQPPPPPPSHAAEVHSLISENLRVEADTPHSIISDNLRIDCETPHSMIPENLRVTPESSRMVPENLCLTDPGHQTMPENLHVRHETHASNQHTIMNGIVANGRALNHSNPSGSPVQLMRPHYEPSPHRIMGESHSLRVQSPPQYSDNMYRNDIPNIGTPAPPTPAPSVPPMPDQSSTPLPQYYSYSHPTHNPFPSYISDANEEREPMRESMSLEEKIERGYQDIKPFDQDYPVPMPMMHISQESLPPPPPPHHHIPKPSKPKKLKEPKPPRMPLVHKCNDCLRIFKNSTQLKNHMWRHTGEKPFTCDECGSKFTQQGNLRAHRRIHTGERPYHCSECKACFTQLSTLKTHQKIHSDERPYKCNECDAAFRQIANLKTHQVTHTGERPHKCDQCEKAFTQKSNLKAHKNRVHSGDGLALPAKRGRKKNPVAIKPYSCLECGAKFTVLSNLKIHAKLHSGDKPFECDFCGAGFAQRSNLKTHIQRMHGRTPGQPRRRIRCDECPAMFRLRRCLKTHKKRRHPIKSLKIKILGESRYHMNATTILEEETPPVAEDEEEEDAAYDDDDDDDDDDGDDDENDDFDDKGGTGSKNISDILKTEVKDVYESEFDGMDEEPINNYRAKNKEISLPHSSDHFKNKTHISNVYPQLKNETDGGTCVTDTVNDRNAVLDDSVTTNRNKFNGMLVENSDDLVGNKLDGTREHSSPKSSNLGRENSSAELTEYITCTDNFLIPNQELKASKHIPHAS